MARYNIEIGCVDFRSLRERQLCYVDKTKFMEELLAANRPTVSLITRPRRFGKTLTMNMLKEFFDIRRKGTTSFDGLAIKRNHNIKDYGHLIPGHGGILDRFDSMIFTAPAIYFAMTFLQ